MSVMTVEVPRPVVRVNPRLVMWVALAVATIGPMFIPAPGRYFADTQDTLWFAPGWHLRHSLTIFQPDVFLLEWPTVGVSVALIWLLKSIGLSLWVTQRIWYGLLAFAGAAGTVLLVQELRGRRTLIAPASAGLLYVFTPFTFGYGLLYSIVFVPYFVLPWLLLVTVRGLRSPSLLWPVLFGLSSFLMGASNGAAQIYALIPPIGYGLWAVFVERTVSPRAALRFAAIAGGFVATLNAYWLFAPRLVDIGNVIQYSEQPKTINQVSSYSESIRGLGHWQYYGGDKFGPWVPMVRRYLTAPAFVLLGFAMPVAAILTAWLVRGWRTRLFFFFLAAGAVVGMAGIFPSDSPAPFGRLLLLSYRHVTALAGLRTTYKLAGVLNLSLAVLAGVGLEEAWRWVVVRRRRAWTAFRQPMLAAAAVAVIGANAFPLWTGEYRPVRTSPAIPEYWRSALRYLQQSNGEYLSFFAPGALQPMYRWGSLLGTVAEAEPTVHPLYAWPFPEGNHYRTNMLAAVERPYQAGVSSTRAAVLFRYLGVDRIVLQNDIDWQRSNTASPVDLLALALDPSLQGGLSFGQPGQNTFAATGDAPPDSDAGRIERSLRPVQILAVPNPVSAIRAESGPPVVVSGDAFGLSAVAEQGLLDSNPPVLYSGTLNQALIATLGKEHPLFVITDSNRRAAHRFNLVRDNTTYTLAPGEVVEDRPIGWGLFGDRPETQTTAILEGVKGISASGYGSVFLDQPQYRPARAFDDDDRTSWLVGGLEHRLGDWIQTTFERPLDLASVRLTVPAVFGRMVRSVQLEFSTGPPVRAQVHRGSNEITFQTRATAFLRVRIVGVTTQAFDNPVGFSEISIPGLHVQEWVRVPSDLLRTATGSPLAMGTVHSSSLAYVFERARKQSPLSGDQELGIARQFEVPESRSLTFAGSAHLDSTGASDDEIDRLIAGPSDIQATSSSRLSDIPSFRASAALDGDPETAWISAGDAGEWIRVRFPARSLNHLVILPAMGSQGRRIQRIEVSFSEGEPIIASIDDRTGSFDVRFPPRGTSEVQVRVLDTAPSEPFKTAGIAELQIPGVTLPPVAGEDEPPCLRDQTFSMDGVPVGVQIEAPISDVLGGKSFSLSACESASLSLGKGVHRLLAGGALQPDSIRLMSLRESPEQVSPPPPPISVRHGNDGALEVDVFGARAPFYLVTGNEWSPEWRASTDGNPIGGRSIGGSLVLDGSSLGWRVDRAGSYHISIRYGPQGSYSSTILLSAEALILTLVIVVVQIARRRT
jgi:arabinofuranan 3-O-arabinosyltransferase